MTIHPEVLLAVGYAIFLVGIALGLDLLARHSHARSERYRTAGFTYHPSHDAWVCPEDQLLVRSEVDHERRLVRYRGRPQICNYCPAKAECTDLRRRKEVVRAMDPWPHSEAGHFHRGISLAVALIAGLILAAESTRNHAPLEPRRPRGRARCGHARSLALACRLPGRPCQLPDLASRPII